MDTFGKRMAALREERKLPQEELVKLLSTSISVIGKYERDEMTPSIDVAKNISNHSNTTVGYLLEETDKADLIKDPLMLQQSAVLDKMKSTEKSHILHILDGFIKSVKLKKYCCSVMFDKLFSKKSIQDSFWDWFKKNSNTYYNFEYNQDYLFNSLKSELNKIHPDLVFEFSPILQDGKREFVISADGIKSVFPVVKGLVQKAPKFDKWHIVAFRQPHKGINHINYDNLIVNLDDVYFRFGKDNGQIALELNIKGFDEATEWTGATFILLDNVLGEYYTEMSLSRIEKKLLNEQEIKDLYPITALPKIVQDYYAEWNN